MTLNWQGNDYFGLLLQRDKRAHGALEMLVDDLHAEKERTISRFLCHSGSEDFLWGLVRLLGNSNSRVAGNSAYILGTLAESELGCYRVISLTSSNNPEGAKILPDLTNMLTFNDSESVMNAAGTMGTLAESHEGRMWMLSESCLVDTLTHITALLSNDNLWTASNAALVLARLTIAEEGCERLLAHREVEHILTRLVLSLGVDEAGRGMNAAFAIGRLCDMEWGRNKLLSLPDSEKMVSSLAKMLCCSDTGASKNACFALSCLATNKEGHQRLLKNTHSEEVLKTLSELLSADDAETGWFAAMTLRTLASQPKGCLRLRDNHHIIPALKAIQDQQGVSQDLLDEVIQTVEILKRLEKSAPPNIQVLGPTEIKVTWAQMTTKSGFSVRYHLFEEGRCVYQGRELTYTLAGLKPHTHYTFRVRAVADGDEGALSDPVTVITEEAVKPPPPTSPPPPSPPPAESKNCVPGPVSNLRVLGATTTQLKVAWDPPTEINGILRGYVINAGKATEHTNDTTYILTGLTQNTVYEVQVCAHTSTGKGPKESVVGTTSELGAHAPSKPEVIVRGRNELHVSWKPPEVPLGRISRYDVLCDGESVYSGTELHYTVHRLQPNTEYNFQVVAITSEGKCESKTTKKRTAKDGFEGDRAPLYQPPVKKEQQDPEVPKPNQMIKKRKSVSNLTNSSAHVTHDAPSPKTTTSVRATSASSSKRSSGSLELVPKRASVSGDTATVTASVVTTKRQSYDVGVAECIQLHQTALPKIKYKSRRQKTPVTTDNHEAVVVRRGSAASKGKDTDTPKRRDSGSKSEMESPPEPARPQSLSAKSRVSRTSEISELSMTRSATHVGKEPLPKPKKYDGLPKARSSRGSLSRSTTKSELSSSGLDSGPLVSRKLTRKKSMGDHHPEEQRPITPGFQQDKKPAMRAIANVTQDLLAQAQNNSSSKSKLPQSSSGLTRDPPLNNVEQVLADRRNSTSEPDSKWLTQTRRVEQPQDLSHTFTSLQLSNYRDQTFKPTSSQSGLRSGFIELDAALPLPSHKSPPALPPAQIQRTNTMVSSHRYRQEFPRAPAPLEPPGPLMPLKQDMLSISATKPGVKRNLDKLSTRGLPNNSSNNPNQQWKPDFPNSAQVERSHNKFVPMQLRTQPANLPSSMQRQVTNLALLERGHSSLRLDFLPKQSTEIDLRNPVYMYGSTYKDEDDLANTQSLMKDRLPSGRSSITTNSDAGSADIGNGHVINPQRQRTGRTTTTMASSLALSPPTSNETKLQSAR